MLKKNYALCLCAGILLISCATRPEVYQEIDQAVEQNDFEQGVEVIVQAQGGNKPIYPEKNAVLLFLDKGILEHYAGRSGDSSNSLQEAERLIEEAYTKSVTREVGSYILNDNTKEYPGEDFEDIYINVFNALNYYHNGNIDGALVEIRKLTRHPSGKLVMLKDKYNTPDAEQTRQQMSATGFATSDLPAGGPVNFSDSALARYLSALFYLAEGNTDSARIEFEHLGTAFAANRNVYSGSLPKAVVEAQSVPAGKARLNIIGFTGMSPLKEEDQIQLYFPFFQTAAMQWPVLKIPKLVDRPNMIDRVEMVIGSESFNLELLEDMGAVIKETFNARLANIVLKTVARTLIKYAALDVAAIAAQEQGVSSFAAELTAIAAKAAFDATESADIRMSRYLPGKAYIGGVNLDPGAYAVRVRYWSGGSLVAEEEQHVNVKANTLNLIEAVSLK